MKKICFLCLSILVSHVALTQQSEIIIQFHHEERLKNFQTSFPDFTFRRTLIADLNIHLFEVSREKNASLSFLKEHPMIKDATWNDAVESRNVEPNDQAYHRQWALERIGMPKVWEISTGGKDLNRNDVVVAIIDKDFSIEHEDLSENTWINTSEVIGDGIDNDGNNYIDDIYGWNFRTNTGQLEERSNASAHGIPISGIIGGVGNNAKGVSGMNWNVKMMYLQYDTGKLDELILAYEYIIDMRRKYNESNGAQGAFVVALNASFGLPTPRICEASDIWNDIHNRMGAVGILIAAASANQPVNVDEVGDTPSACPSDYIIAVTSTDTLDHRWQSSAFGKIGVDLAAPGIDIFTTFPDDKYGLFRGNSAAAPHIAGAIAMLYSLPCELVAEQAISKPAETALKVKQSILDGVESLKSLEEFTLTKGRLNVFNAIIELEEFCDPTPLNTDQFTIKTLYPSPVKGQLSLQYETPTLTYFTIRIFDAIGRVLLERQANSCCSKINEETFDVSNFESGIYFLQIEHVKGSMIQSFVVK